MEYITELSTGWAELKQATVRFIGLTQKSPLLQQMAKSMQTCGEVLAFQPDENGELRFRSSWFCRNRLCPMCIKRRSLKQYAEACRLIEAMPEGTWLHLVLTIPNVPFSDLGGAISTMNRASSFFFRDPLIRRAFRGILRVLEVTYNPVRDDWHPHFHCLIYAPKSYCTNPKLYLKREVLLDKWAAAVGLPVTAVYVSKVKNPLEAIPEIVKYCFKPYQGGGVKGISELAFYEHIFEALHGRRCVQTYGLIRDKVRELRIDLEGDEDDTAPRADDPGMLLLRYDRDRRRYTLAEQAPS